MLRRVLCLIVVICGALPAQAEWRIEDDGRVATVCALDRDRIRLCLSFGCSEGGALGVALGHAGLTELTGAQEAEVLVSVGGRDAGLFAFDSAGPNRMEAPLREDHVPGLALIEGGATATLSMRADPQASWDTGPLTLRGSGAAMRAARAACPLPDFSVPPRTERTVADPKAYVLAEVSEACAALGGSVTERGGMLREIDLDGSGPMDLVVYHVAAECSAAPTFACGPEGCRQSVWVAEADGRFRQVLARPLYGLAVLAPGEVALDLNGQACDRSANEVCRKRFVLGNDLLVDQGEVGALP